MTRTLAGLFGEVDCVHHLVGRIGIRIGWRTIVEAYTVSIVLTSQRLTEARVVSVVPKVTITPSFSLGRPLRRSAPFGPSGRSSVCTLVQPLSTDCQR